MEILGIHNYITESTIYGDWSCTTYKITEDPYKVINNFVEAQEKEKIMESIALNLVTSAQTPD